MTSVVNKSHVRKWECREYRIGQEQVNSLYEKDGLTRGMSYFCTGDHFGQYGRRHLYKNRIARLKSPWYNLFIR